MRFIITISIGISIFLGCSSGPDYVAEVGKVKVSTDEFRRYLAERYSEKESYKDVEIKEKEAILDQIVLRKLKLNAAYDLDLDKNEKIMRDYDRQQSEHLANRYFEKVVIDQLFSEDRLYADFEMKKNEVKVSHVLIGFKGSPKSMNDRTKEEAFTLAQDIAEQARAGKNIEHLALLHSDDLTVKDNRGRLDYFTWGSMVEPFQERAYQMEIGQVSDPVLTDFGYHVILLEDKRPNLKYDEKNYEKSEENIKRSLYRTKRDTARKMWDLHLKSKKEEYGFSVKRDSISSYLQINNEKKNNGLLTRDNFSADELQTVLAAWKNGSFLVIDLLNSYGDHIRRFHKNLTDSATANADIDRIASHKFVAQLAEEMDLQKEKKIADQLSNFLEFQLIKMVEEKEVKEKVSFDDEDLKSYYTANKKEFTIPEKIEIWEVYKSREKMAQNIYEMAKSGKNFEKLAEKYSEDTFYKKKKGYVGFKPENGRGSISKAAFDAGQNKIIAPVKYKKGWTVIKTGKKQPETLRSFEKVKKQIENKVRYKKTRELKEFWEADLRDKYRVVVKKDLIAEI